jgi:hypothetical protein
VLRRLVQQYDGVVHGPEGDGRRPLDDALQVVRRIRTLERLLKESTEPTQPKSAHSTRVYTARIASCSFPPGGAK